LSWGTSTKAFLFEHYTLQGVPAGAAVLSRPAGSAPSFLIQDPLPPDIVLPFEALEVQDALANIRGQGSLHEHADSFTEFAILCRFSQVHYGISLHRGCGALMVIPPRASVR
jgi:hypothetical protein